MLPNFKNKHAHQEMFSPKDYLRYQRKKENYDKFSPPQGVILCYSKRLLDYVIKTQKVKKVDRFYGEMYLLTATKNKIAIVGKFGIGAPAVATLVDELIAFGVKKFISIGIAGTLQKNLKPGDLVVCDKAIRDEGTSYHYLKPSKYSFASKNITKMLSQHLNQKGKKYIIGTTWTIDAPYRETVAEAKRYQKEGVATVEMEIAALFALVEYRGAEMGAALTVSDSLAELYWVPSFHYKNVLESMKVLYRTSVDVLLSVK